MGYLANEVRKHAKTDTKNNWYFLDFISDSHLERLFYDEGESQHEPIDVKEAIEISLEEIDYIFSRIHDSRKFIDLFKSYYRSREKYIKEYINNDLVY